MSFPNIVHADDQQVYANDVARGLPVGQRVELPDGRTFRYALAGGTALVSADLIQCSIQLNSDNNDTLTITTTAAIGDSSLAITNGATTWTLDELKGGLLVNERAEELGAHGWRIHGNTAEAAGSAAMTITLTPGVTFDTALTAGTSLVSIAPSPWSKVIQFPGTISGIPVGVAMRVVTAAYYGYLQTHGMAAVLIDTAGSPTVGDALVPADAAAGSVDRVSDDTNAPNVGFFASIRVDDADIGQAFLTID